MNAFAVVMNLLLVGFTAAVVATDGAPTQPVYIVLTLSLLLIPLLNAVVLASSHFVQLRRVLAGGNLLLVAFVGWAIVDQYPHPDEEGFIAFVIVTIAVPLLSSAQLFRRPAEAQLMRA